MDSISTDDEIMVHLESAQELIDYNRNTTDLVADIYRNLKLTRKAQSRTFEEEVRYLKYLLLFETFLPPGKLIQDYPELEGDLSTIGAMSVIQNQASLLTIFNDCGVSEDFFTSQEILRCHFLRIRASLMAADIMYYPDMAPTTSLSTDYEIVSSTLPYVRYACY